MSAIKNFVREWKVKSPKNKAYMALGGIFLLAALASVFIPILPQVPFAIIAAFFFAKGSARLHLWIRHNRFFGQPVRDWEDHQIIRPKLKVFSTLAMLAGAGFAYYKLETKWSIAVGVIFLGSIIFVLTRRSSRMPRFLQ
jgi:uncharacterized membrane protein YbaN (DUF454 family)